MNLQTLTLLFILALCLSSCQKLDIEDGTPECIENLIREFDKQQTCDNAKVQKYIFQGEEVYLFDPGNCGADETVNVIDFECNDLGFLGGIGGNNTINGEEFSTATFVSVVWEK